MNKKDTNFDQNFNSAKKIITDSSKKIANFAKQKLTKAKNKLSKKLFKKLTLVVVKAIVHVVSVIISFLWPYLLALLIIAILFNVIWDHEYNGRSVYQEYQKESIYYNNKKELDDNGKNSVISLSKENKLVKAFYTYKANEGYYIKYKDDNKIYTPKEAKNRYGDDLKDLYNREKLFYLSPEMLWVLDQELNGGEFIYPEQFLKPVYGDYENMELKSLTDENGQLTVKSKSYDVANSDPNNPDMTVGIWDYGLSPIIHYDEFDYKTEVRATSTDHTVHIPGHYDSNGQWIEDEITMQSIDAASSTSETTQQTSEEVIMIDKVLTAAGTIKNKINDTTWKDTFNPVTYQKSETQTITRYRRIHIQSVNNLGQKLYYGVTSGHPDSNIKTTTPTPYPVMEYKVETYEENVEFVTIFKGTTWEMKPMYEGEPDTSGIIGSKYYRDYFSNYRVFVPQDVMSEFDIEKRLGMSEEKLIKELKDDEETSTTNSTTVDLTGFTPGSGASSSVVAKSLQYLPIFEKYAKMYGLDPYLLAAKAAQESGGDHDSYISASRCSSAGCGLMQIEAPGNVTTSVQALNVQTNTVDVVTISSYQDVIDVDANIKVGAMMMATKVKEMNGNVLLALQAYNFGSTGIATVINLYSQASGKSVEEIKNNPSDTGWLAFRQEVHQNPNKYFTWNYTSSCNICGSGSGHYGDPHYIENVLRYYVNNSNSNSFSNISTGNYSTKTSSSQTAISKFNNWLKSVWSSIADSFKNVFPEPTEGGPKFWYTNERTEDDTFFILKRMFAMQEAKKMSDMEDFNESYFVSKYSSLFTNPLGSSWNSSTAESKANLYFPGGFEMPLQSTSIVILKHFGNNYISNNSNQYSFHDSVHINATNGTNVYAVYDGEISSIGSNTTIGKYIKIKHANNIETVYGSLSAVESSLKAGDKVKKGDLIGSTGKTIDDNHYALHFQLLNNGVAEDPTWIFIKTSINTQGISTGTASGDAQAAVNTALSVVGCPYVFGAIGEIMTEDVFNHYYSLYPSSDLNGYPGLRNIALGKQAFDCSGLIIYSYKIGAGKDLSNTRSTTAMLSSTVHFETVPSITEIQPGDLVFTSPGHVQMYIGNNQIVHAPQPGDYVKIGSLSTSYYRILRVK